MIKQTIVISTPRRLSLRNHLLVIAGADGEEPITRPVANIGILILEDTVTTVTLPLLNALAAANVMVVICDGKHCPATIVTPLEGNTTQSEVLRAQCQMTLPQLKQAWKQIITAKIANQKRVLDLCGLDGDILSPHVRNVLSGDTTNREGVAARLYWTEMFDEAFVRDHEGDGINALLNYGYAILRAATIRALIGSGVSPAFGIFHRNRYNAFPLADDVMEPFRPFVDIVVYELWKQGQAIVNKKTKSRLLKVLTCDVLCGDVMRPLMLALSSTTASLSSYILRKSQVLTLPQIP